MSRLTSSKANKVSATALLSLPSCRRNSRLALLTVGELEEAAVNIPKRYQKRCALLLTLLSRKCSWKTSSQLPPKVEFADRVGEASGILIGNFAKVVGIGPNKLFAWMRDHKILIASGSRRNVPMQEYMERGYFTVKETAVNTNHGIQISFTTKITGRG